MAASAVYSKLSQVFRGDSKVTLDKPTEHANIASTTAAFTLSGGTYTRDTLFSGTGSVTLQTLSNDGSTWIPVEAISTSGTHSWTNLAPGTYRLVIA